VSLPWLLAGDALLAGLAFGLIIYRKRRASSYDPNATDEDERKVLGRSREVLGEDRESMLRARQEPRRRLAP
jgi:hypothetical protein